MGCHKSIVFGLVFLAWPVILSAQAPQFTWKQNDKLVGTVEHVTLLHETALDETTKTNVTTTTQTKLNLVRQWQVVRVHPNGSADLDFLLTKFRQELRQQEGTQPALTKLLDSQVAEDAAAMPFLGKPMFQARVGNRGAVQSLTPEQPSVLDRLKVELPFRVELPNEELTLGTKWQRTCTIVLGPPLGTGEQFETIQKFSVTNSSGPFRTIGFATELKSPPTDASLMPALVPYLAQGSVIWDTQENRVTVIRATVKHTVKNHRGEGSSLTYESTYSEDLNRQ